jgi:hypothetical protein
VAVLLPAHLPFNPQVVPADATHAVVGSGSVMPAGIAEHVPTDPASLQDSHVPPHAVSQHTPLAPSAK